MGPVCSQFLVIFLDLQTSNKITSFSIISLLTEITRTFEKVFTNFNDTSNPNSI